MMDQELEQIVHCLRQLQAEFEDLAVGGLCNLGPEHLPLLHSLCEQLDAIGARHTGSRLQTLAAAVERDDKHAASALMQAQASLRLFERILTAETMKKNLRRMVDMEHAES